MKFRSSLPEIFYRKISLKFFAKFTGKHLCWSLFFNKETFLIKRLWHRCFPVIFENLGLMKKSEIGLHENCFSFEKRMHFRGHLFQANILFLYPLKIPEKRFSDIFKGCTNGTFSRGNNLMTQCYTLNSLYELPAELPNDSGLKKLGNIRKTSKLVGGRA